MKRLALLFVAAAALAQSPDIHREALVLDGHVHVMTRQLLEGLDIGDRYPDGHIDLPRAREGGVDAMFFTVYTPEPYYPGRHEVTNTLRVVELARDQIEKNFPVIELARNATDIERIVGLGKIAAFLDLEGAFDLDGDLLILRALYRLGLRSAQLTAHNYTNNFADSCCDVSKWNGLNEQGLKVIAEMNNLGMVINVAHGSEETILQTVEASRDPVVYTHGGFRHFVDIPRCISDKAAKAIAEKGGVVGLQFGNTFNNPKFFKWRNQGPPVANISSKLGGYATMPLAEIDEQQRASLPFVYKGELPKKYRMTMKDFAKVIDYGVNLIGEDHIALGSDFDGGPPLPQGMEDISDYPEMTKAMQDLGYSDERIRKILGGNLLRVIRQVTEQ
ncbi:MAG: dipeptidase [Bryobacterales bacterium]